MRAWLSSRLLILRKFKRPVHCPPSCSTASVKPTASGCCGLVVFQGEVTEMVADNKRCLPVDSWVEWTGIDTRADNTGC